MILETRIAVMNPKPMGRINRLLAMVGQQLGLCCHHAVGNIPPAMLRNSEIRWGRLR